jgi:hypothetical protein
MRVLTILILLLSNGLSAKPITFVVSDLFGSAKFVGEVVITGYNGTSKIFFESTQYKDTISSAGCPPPAKSGENYGDSLYWTGNVPSTGDTVIIVVNGYNRITIFGKRIERNYRLWSPIHGRSVSMFVFEYPVLPLDTQRVSGHAGDSTSCWDGCLVPIDQFSALRKDYKTRFAKKLEAVNISRLVGKEALYIFYEDPLRQFSSLTWTDEPPGKLQSLILNYSNGRSLEVVPVINKESPTQFDITRRFDLEKFKSMNIKEIRWVK